MKHAHYIPLALIAGALLCGLPLLPVARAEVLPSEITDASEQPASSLSGAFRHWASATVSDTTTLRSTSQISTTGRLLFSDGAETGDLMEWKESGGSAFVVQQDEIANGTFALRATSTGAPVFLVSRLNSAPPEIYYRMRFKILHQDPQNTVTLMSAQNPDINTIADLYVNSAGVLGLRNYLLGVATDSTIMVANSAWHEAQMHIRLDCAGSQIEIWLDGSRIDTLSTTVPNGLSYISQIQLGDIASGLTYDIAFDDIAVDDHYVESWRGPDPVPATINIQTVPPTVDVPFSLDDRKIATDAQGATKIDLADLSPKIRQAIKIDDNEVDPGVSAKLGRWYWNGRRAVAALDMYYRIKWHFVDLDGRPVDPQRITSLTMRSSHGIVHEFNTSDLGMPQWLQGSRVVPEAAGLLNKDIYYNIDKVIIDGTNVVNQSQQRFFAATQHELSIQLLFYPAHFTVQDVLFRFPIGSAIHLEYPDGHAQVLPLSSNGEATIDLPRGEYHVYASGLGLHTVSPLAMTRNQEVDIKFISYLDILVVFALLSGIALGLLFFGRPQSLFILRHPRELLRVATSVRLSRPGWRGLARALGSVVGIIVVLIAAGVTGLHLAGVAAFTSQSLDDPNAASVPVVQPVDQISRMQETAPVTIRPDLQTQTSSTKMVYVPPVLRAPQIHISPQCVAAPKPAGVSVSSSKKTPLEIKKRLFLGSRGGDVRQVQTRLYKLRYLEALPKRFGYFGPETFRAVEQFQTDRGLPVSGIVGPMTIGTFNQCGQECVRGGAKPGS
jgi:Putative peptidoglycan binding domain